MTGIKVKKKRKEKNTHIRAIERISEMLEKSFKGASYIRVASALAEEFLPSATLETGCAARLANALLLINVILKGCAKSLRVSCICYDRALTVI